MTAALFRILKRYAALERAVSRQMSAICEPYCSVCRDVCCGPQYCRETTVSPFLTNLISGERPAKPFNPEYGWLTSAGCALTVGRPPVCYQFSCSKIINALPNDDCRYHFQVLSELVPHIGKRALGSRHLVEILDPGQLQYVKLDRFERRLQDAWKALNVVRSSTSASHSRAQNQTDLSKIVPVPAYMKPHGMTNED